MKVDKCVILAAGQGTRMRSKLPKVLHPLCGRPMIDWVIRTVVPVCSQPNPIVIVNDLEGEVADYLHNRASYNKGNVILALQAEQLGTGHALQCARPHLKGLPRNGYVLIAAGDMPLLSTASLQALCDATKKQDWAAGILTAKLENPTNYGRILRDRDGNIQCIVEQRDATPEQAKVQEINTSVYCFQSEPLLEALQHLTTANDQAEYYLTDCIGYLVAEGKAVGGVCAENPLECLGVNDRVQLAAAAKLLRRRICQRHMLAGVTIVDPATTYIDDEVVIGMDTIVSPGNHLQGATVIGESAVLYPDNRIVHSTIGNGAQIQSSVIQHSQVGAETTIGPFVQLRPGSVVGDHCRIGNFVEVKKSDIGDNSKVSHLSYIGDGSIGSGVNIGCGVVFVNYDGQTKNQTVVEDDAFVGCNSNLVAPVTIGQNAYVAAGSTITKDVPAYALGIERARQVNRENWVIRQGREKK